MKIIGVKGSTKILTLIGNTYLVSILNSKKFTVVGLNLKKDKYTGYLVDDDTTLMDELIQYCDIDRLNKTIKIKEKYLNLDFLTLELEYIKANGVCTFAPYRTNKFDNNYIVKTYGIVNKNSAKDYIDKVLINLTVVVESPNNKWYNVKYVS